MQIVRQEDIGEDMLAPCRSNDYFGQNFSVFIAENPETEKYVQ